MRARRLVHAMSAQPLARFQCKAEEEGVVIGRYGNTAYIFGSTIKYIHVIFKIMSEL